MRIERRADANQALRQQRHLCVPVVQRIATQVVIAAAGCLVVTEYKVDPVLATVAVGVLSLPSVAFMITAATSWHATAKVVEYVATGEFSALAEGVFVGASGLILAAISGTSNCGYGIVDRQLL